MGISHCKQIECCFVAAAHQLSSPGVVATLLSLVVSVTVYEHAKGMVCFSKIFITNYLRSKFGQTVGNAEKPKVGTLYMVVMALLCVLSVFILIWFIIGNVWVFTSSDDLCMPRPYRAALWYIIVVCICLSLILYYCYFHFSSDYIITRYAD